MSHLPNQDSIRRNSHTHTYRRHISPFNGATVMHTASKVSSTLSLISRTKDPLSTTIPDRRLRCPPQTAPEVRCIGLQRITQRKDHEFSAMRSCLLSMAGYSTNDCHSSTNPVAVLVRWLLASAVFRKFGQTSLNQNRTNDRHFPSILIVVGHRR